MRTFIVACVVSLTSASTVVAGRSQDLLMDSPTETGRRVMSANAVTGSSHLDDPPFLTLRAALNEALIKNPRLIVLRREYQALQHRPAQARALAPPSFDVQVWQWPFNTLNPRNVNMYMFTFGQSLPGRGKRELRAMVAQKDTERSLAAIVLEARDVIDDVKRTYAELFLARREIAVHHANVDLLRQFADVSEAKYVTGRISQ